MDDLMLFCFFLSLRLSFSLPFLFLFLTTHLEVPALAHGLGDAVERRVSRGRAVVATLLGCFEGDWRRRQTFAVKAWRGGRGGSSGERHKGREEEAERGIARHDVVASVLPPGFCYFWSGEGEGE